MSPPLTVVDAHRLIGPVPTGDVESRDAAGLLAELDRLRIDQAYVTHTLSLYADPVSGNQALFAETRNDPRLRPVPVVIPGVPGASVPDSTERLVEWRQHGVRLVRFCPVRHRFDLADPITGEWLTALAYSGIAVAVAFDEAPPATLRTLTTMHPRLGLLVLAPGYRRLRELAALLQVAPTIVVESGTLITQRGVEWLAARCGGERLVFGTGAPLLDDCGPRFQLDHLDLPPTTVASIAAGSLESFLTASEVAR